MAPELPSTRASTAAHASSAILETALATALEKEGREGRVVARLAARPSRAATGIRMINESPAMGILRGDHGFWEQVEQGNLDVAMEREGFTALVRDAAVRRRMADLGLVEEASARDPEAFRAELAEVLSALGPRLRGLRQAPDPQALVRDPEVRGMLQQSRHEGKETKTHMFQTLPQIVRNKYCKKKHHVPYNPEDFP